MLDYLADDKLQIKIFGFKDLKKRADGNNTSMASTKGVNDTLGSSFDQSRSGGANTSMNTSGLGSTRSGLGAGNRSMNKSGFNPLA